MTARRPRILHVYKDYWPPIVGGIEKTIHWLARGAADEYDVTVLVCARGRGDAEERDGPVRVVKAGEWGRFASAPISPRFPARLAALSADILHFHHPNPTGEIAYLLRRPPGRVAVTYHSDIVRQRAALRLYAPFLRRFLRRADVILPTSPNYVESSAFLRPLRDKCEPIPLGIPLGDYAATPEREAAAAELRRRYGVAPGESSASGSGPGMILFVGQFREYKGLPFLIEALRRVDAPWRAVLIGDGPCRPRIEQMIRQAGLGDRVTLTGRLPDEVVALHLHACDMFVLPSHRRSEAFGIVQVEAMACGKPVISARLDTGVPFVNRDGETGLTVEPASPAALADAIERLLGQPDLRRRMGDAARRRARDEFSVETMIARVKQVYRRLLEARV